MVDALEGTYSASQGDNASARTDDQKEGIEFFVTKHEVLMLRRVMGAAREDKSDKRSRGTRRGKK